MLPPSLPTAVQTILVSTASFALLTMGLNVVVGFAGLLDLGYVAFLATGAYAWGILSGAGPIKIRLPANRLLEEWGFWVVLLVAIFMNMLIGVALGLPHPAAAGRLPGDRHPRLRRDRPIACQQPRCS